MEQLISPADPRAAFRTKSVGVSLVVILGVGAYYLANLSAGEGPAWLALSALALVVVVEATLQAVLAIGAGGVPARSALDRRAAGVAAQAAYPVLVAGALASFAGWLLGAPHAFSAHLIVIGLILAESVRLAAQLVAYVRPAAASR